ncbi:SDR family NAD(P)-dependent oxidoreductase [Nocardioides sp.]|uniref:SDR family NAD(P)-dependent oxidoreductase n=1 Tax=Nocardioides sp. TaxID=35761 RepID=UPI0035110AA4
MPEPVITPEDLATTLRVLDAVHLLPGEHPDHIAVRRATARMFKAVKRERKLAARAAELAHDRAVLEATATGSPLRIDDETEGLLPTSAAREDGRAVAGELINPRGCYICKHDYTRVDAFYHWLCPDCAARSHAKREQGTDLAGRRALLTGGRAKIGMHIALRLLRDGADLTLTTRFPRDAVRRYAGMPDSASWLHRLTIVGIDLRDPTQVAALADDVAARGPLDVLINNACQTVRRQPGSYAPLVEAERLPLPDGVALPEMVTFDRVSELHPAAISGALAGAPVAHHAGESAEHARAVQQARSAADLTALALHAGSASLEAHLAGTAVDAGGLLPDVVTSNSWTQTVDQVDPLELLEVQMCNAVAPFLLVSRLRPALAAAAAASPSGRAHVVNVSAMEGQFSRRYKGPGHPHTNMAKAALNMMTRTSAGEMFERDRILMNAVDTGWITDERPHYDKLRIAAEGWHAPLDLVDGAARVYDPIVRGERGEDLHGHFLKDYDPSPW